MALFNDGWLGLRPCRASSAPGRWECHCVKERGESGLELVRDLGMGLSPFGEYCGGCRAKRRPDLRRQDAAGDGRVGGGKSLGREVIDFLEMAEVQPQAPRGELEGAVAEALDVPTRPVEAGHGRVRPRRG